MTGSINVASSAPGSRMTPHILRLAVWDFYHNNSTPSTNTSQPARLRVDRKKMLHKEMPFVDTCRVVRIRKRDYYENHWFILDSVLRALYTQYLLGNLEKPVSLGIFHELCPFYVRTPTTKDIEMCCCKTHLHAKWVIEALISNVKKQRELELAQRRKEREEKIEKGIFMPEVVDDSMPLPFDDYRTFYSLLTNDCGTNDMTYISWDCT